MWLSAFPSWIDSFEWRTSVTPYTSVEFLVAAHATYFMLAFSLSKFMQSHKGPLPGLRAYTFVHNLGMSILSGCLLFCLVVAAVADGRFGSIDALSCNRPKPSVGLLPFTVYIFYLSKMLEFVDTLLLIGTRKRVAWLHVIHHSLTMSCVWHAMDSGLATEVVCTGLNCLVHIFVYFYFALPVRALRPVITLAQLLQFTICLAAQCFTLAARYQLVPGMSSAPCSGTALADWHGFGMYLLFLGLFGHFFFSHYVQSSKAKSPRSGPVTRTTSLRPPSPIPDFNLGPCAAGMDATGVDNPCAGGGLSVSDELLQASFGSALRMLSKACAFMAVGWLMMIYTPIYMTPVGVFITGISFSWFYTIGHDCAQMKFFPSNTVNTLVGIMLRPDQFATGGVSGGVSVHVVGISLIMAAGLSVSVYTWGLATVVKLWLLPFVVMHLNVRSFSSKAGKPSNGNVSGALSSFQIMFPELEHILSAADDQQDRVASRTRSSSSSNSSPSSSPSLKPRPSTPNAKDAAMQDLLASVPLYNLPRAARQMSAQRPLMSNVVSTNDIFDAALNNDRSRCSNVCNEGAGGAADHMWSFLPSRLLTRELLFWRHRDVAFWGVIASFVLMIALVQSRGYAWLPLAFLFLFMGPKSAAAKAVAEWQDMMIVHPTQEVVQGSIAELRSVWRHFIKNANWPMAIYISLVHVGAVAGLFHIPHCHARTLVLAVILWPISGFGITGGAHRLWAHRSYKASGVYRAGVMVCNSIANQGTIFHWVRDHRVHHKHSEGDADPHDARRGFVFAHIGWLYLKKRPEVIEAGKTLRFDDLFEDGPVMFQKALDPLWNLSCCFVLPATIAYFGWGESVMCGFLVPGVFRYCAVLHFTWLVNSAAHLYGGHPYDHDSNPAENPIVSILAVGEGWHNWHHLYPNDYAASELGVSSQFNPTKLIIDFFAKLGMVWDRKKSNGQWERRKARMAAGHEATEKLQGPPLLRVRKIFIQGEDAEAVKTD